MDHDTILKPIVTLPHIAFARGWINGLDLNELGARYIAQLGSDDGEVDLRVIKGTLIRVLKELSGAAERNGIPGAAVLFRQASRIRVSAAPPGLADADPRPTFDEYIEEHPYADDFSMEELRASYLEAHPPRNAAEVAADRALARRQRLIENQLALISRLQRLVATPLSVQDDIDRWFEPNITKRLQAGDFKRIADLVNAIMSRPKTWFEHAPGIGQAKATRIERFLRSHLGSFDALALSMPKVIKQWAPESAANPVLAMDAITRSVPSPSLPGSSGVAHLDGSAGRLRDRANASAIEASNDYEAMQTWLRLKKSKATVALYEREVTRLIAWAIQVRGKAMSSLSLEDALAYRDFLYDVPETILIKKGPRRTSRDTLQDQGAIAVAGFTKQGLSTSTVKKALVIISGFFSWLLQVRYVSANPFIGVTADRSLAGIGMGSTQAEDVKDMQRARDRRKSVRDRVLPQEAVDAAITFLDGAHPTEDRPAIARMRFVFLAAVMMGLRISEIASARRDHLEYVQPDPAADLPGCWILHVLGKRDKPREVPVPDRLIPVLEEYLETRGLLQRPSPSLPVPPGTFLVGALPSHTATPDGPQRSKSRSKAAGDGVRPQAIHHVLKQLFDRVLIEGRFKDESSRDKLRRASAHWLRHTMATHSVAQDVPLDVVASVLGHADISTTSIYVHAERKRKRQEMQRAWSNRGSPIG